MNGSAGMPFAPAEYAARLDAVRLRMAGQDLAALLVTDPANIYYLTGYDAWSFYMPQLLFVPAEGELVLFIRQMDVAGAVRATWLDERQIAGYPESHVQHRQLHPFHWVAAELRRRDLVAAAAAGRAGLEMDSSCFSPRAYLALAGALPEWTLADSFELVNWVRAVKSPAELALMRRAAAITGSAMAAAEEAVRAGARQCDVAAAISHAQITGTEEFGGDYPAIVPLLPTGPAADSPHLTWTDQRLRRDEAVVVELAGTCRRYHVPLSRTFVPGRPSAELARLAGATGEGLEAVLGAVRPGVPVRDLAAIWKRSIARHGYEKESRLGYPVGIGYPPDWGERTISIRAEDDSVLAENMTFHLLCGMWMHGYGYELSESIRVTATGVETFTSYRRGLLATGGQGRLPGPVC